MYFFFSMSMGIISVCSIIRCLSYCFWCLYSIQAIILNCAMMLPLSMGCNDGFENLIPFLLASKYSHTRKQVRRLLYSSSLCRKKNIIQYTTLVQTFPVCDSKCSIIKCDSNYLYSKKIAIYITRNLYMCVLVVL